MGVFIQIDFIVSTFEFVNLYFIVDGNAKNMFF